MNITQLDNAVIFTSGMNIDADGAPNAYHPGGGGLDALGNAGGPGNWYGIVTDTGEADGEPIVQGDDDPCPGFYISPTALSDHSLHAFDPNRYVDSGTVPYISIPPDLKHNQNVRLGDLCVVFYKDMMTYGIVADIGPHGRYGEASICTAQRLSIPDSPRNGGVGSGVTYWIMTGTGKGWPRTTLEKDAENAFENWGGLAKLKSLDLLS